MDQPKDLSDEIVRHHTQDFSHNWELSIRHESDVLPTDGPNNWDEWGSRGFSDFDEFDSD